MMSGWLNRRAYGLIAPTARHAARENEHIRFGHAERSRSICFEPDALKSRFLTALGMTVSAGLCGNKYADIHAQNGLYFPMYAPKRSGRPIHLRVRPRLPGGHSTPSSKRHRRRYLVGRRLHNMRNNRHAWITRVQSQHATVTEQIHVHSPWARSG